MLVFLGVPEAAAVIFVVVQQKYNF